MMYMYFSVKNYICFIAKQVYKIKCVNHIR